MYANERTICIIETIMIAEYFTSGLCDELSDCGFLRCHRSYMVNFQHVHVMRSDGFFVLDDQKHTTIPIGIRYKYIAEDCYLKETSLGE